MTLALLLALLIAVAPTDTAGVRTITAAEIARSGALRFSDLLPLLDGWHGTSIDGYHTALTPPGGAPDEAGWEVWIDGAPFLPGLPVPLDLNLVPVPLADIDRIEVVRGAVLEGGRVLPGGLLHVHTRPPARRFETRLSYGLANETGDPGPFRFLGSTDRNVDHSGPDASASLALGRRIPWLAAVSTQTHYATDPLIFDRVQALSREFPKIKTRQGLVSAGRGGSRGMVAAVLRDDYVHVAPYGRELPARLTHATAAWREAGRLRGATGFRLDAEYHDTGLGDAPTSLAPPFDWHLRRFAASAGVGHVGPRFHTGGGIRAEGRHLATGSTLSRALLRRLSLYGYAAAESVRLDGVAAAGDGGPSFSARASVSPRLAPQAHLRLSAAYLETLPEDEQPLASWTRRGYGLLDTLGIPVAFARFPRQNRHLALDADASLLAGGVYVESSAYFRRFFALAVAARPAEAPSALVAGSHAGTLAGLHVGMRHAAGPRLRHRASVDLAFVPGGDRVFRRAASARPVLTGRSIWTAAPVEGFAAEAHLRAHTAARGAVGGWDGRLPASWTVDLALHKQLWRRRLAAALLLYNLLDRPERTHPLGGTESLRLTVRLTATFGA